MSLLSFTGFGAKTTNKVIQMGFGRLLLLKRLLLLRHTLMTRADKLLVVTCIHGDLLLFDMQDMADSRIQKRLIMRDDNHQTRKVIDPRLKPKNSI